MVENINIKHKQSFTRLEKFAIWITNQIGTMGFFFIIFLWTLRWMAWNVLAPIELRFDPLPAFVLWLFISNAVQLFFLPLIMVGQNLQNRHSELRAESEYEIDLKAEKEIEAVLVHLDHQNQLILKILEKIENKDEKEKGNLN